MQHAATSTRTDRHAEHAWHAQHATPTQPAPKAQPRKPAGPRGSLDYPLTKQMADTIGVHGWAWALHHYSKRLPAAEGIALLRSAARLARVQG